MYSYLVIGGGINSSCGQVHQQALSLCGESRVLNGVFSRDRKLNKSSHTWWSCEDKKVYGNYEALLDAYSQEQPKPIVLCLSPTTNHFDIISASLSYGFPVIVEKPMATSLKQLKTLEKILNRNNGFLRCTYNYSGYPLIRELQYIALNGYLGELQQIILEMPQEGLVKPPLIQGQQREPQNWRLSDPQNVPMVALDLATHLLHTGTYLTKQTFRPLSSLLTNNTIYPITDTIYSLISSNSSELCGALWVTKSAIGTRNGLRIQLYGSKGSAKWYQQYPEELHISAIDGSRNIIDRGTFCHIATLPRYERMKAGHPAGFIEAFANVYIDIFHEYKNHINGMKSETKSHYDINNSMEISAFIEKLATTNIKEPLRKIQEE